MDRIGEYMCDGGNVDDAGFLVGRGLCTYKEKWKETFGEDVVSDDVRSELKIVAIGGELFDGRRHDSSVHDMRTVRVQLF
jgi:hypothetical protein